MPYALCPMPECFFGVILKAAQNIQAIHRK